MEHLMSQRKSQKRHKIQISISEDALCILDEMRGNSSMSRSTLIEIAVRKYYSSEEAAELQLRDTKEDKQCLTVKKRFPQNRQ